VFFAAMPVKSIMGIFVLGLYVSILFHNAGAYFTTQVRGYGSTMMLHPAR
jgi:hypothetical protein